MNATLKSILPPELVKLLDSAEAAGASVSFHHISSENTVSPAGKLLKALGLDPEKEAARATEARRQLASELIPVVRQKIYEADVQIADLTRREVPFTSEESLVVMHRWSSAKELLRVLLEETKPEPSTDAKATPATEQATEASQG
ncbi:MAG: hypothetical protein WAQ08_15875 [Aquabacterium sp.]|uniref:hypothetical protein n=1 Tax=Aquabacterium sp. TaxID=1872578 RepID=UPI003BB0CD17